MSDRGEHYADGGFAAVAVHYPDPARIAAIHAEWEMKSLRLLVDLDGVVVDLMGEAYRRGLLDHEACRWDFNACCTSLSMNDVFAAERLFDDAPPIGGAIEGVNLLATVFDVRFVTSPWAGHWESAAAKYRWVEKHFGSALNVVCAIDKSIVSGWALLDDRPGLTGPWTHLCYPQPWNDSTLPTWENGLAEWIIAEAQLGQGGASVS